MTSPPVLSSGKNGISKPCSGDCQRGARHRLIWYVFACRGNFCRVGTDDLKYTLLDLVYQFVGTGVAVLTRICRGIVIRDFEKADNLGLGIHFFSAATISDTK